MPHCRPSNKGSHAASRRLESSHGTWLAHGIHPLEQSSCAQEENNRQSTKPDNRTLGLRSCHKLSMIIEETEEELKELQKDEANAKDQAGEILGAERIGS